MIQWPVVAANNTMSWFTRGISAAYHIYVNDVVIGPETLLADFKEPGWPGYAPQVVKKWWPTLPLAVPAVWFGDPLVWILSQSIQTITVQGYYVTADPAGELLWCEAAPGGGYDMADVGNCVTIYPQITLTGDVPPATFTPPLPKPFCCRR